MIEAFEKQTVRQAEAKVVAEHPHGALMKKAAGEVSDTTVEFLLARGAKVEETRILGLVGGGDNGGDCLYALSIWRNWDTPASHYYCRTNLMKRR